MDREKVIKGLETCKSPDKTCSDCPYNGEICTTSLCDDVLSLLKEQEARVMTLDEFKEIYVEFKGDDCPIRLTNFDLRKIIMYMDDDICRLWKGKPTDEQRKGVKWE